MTQIWTYFLALFAQPSFVLTVSVMCAIGVAYTFAWFFENWMHGAALFPGLLIGALAMVDFSLDYGLIYGRDKEISIIMAAMVGVGLAVPVQLMFADVMRWLARPSRRRLRAMMNRNQPQG